MVDIKKTGEQISNDRTSSLFSNNESHHEQYIRWFSEISNDDVSIAGGKGASLGEMYNAGFPVPPGFAITAQAFDYFLTQTQVKDKIKSIVDSIVDMEDTDQLTRKSKEIRALIESQELPEDLKEEIIEAYHILSSEKIDTMGVSQSALTILKNSYEPVFVAVRSSATTEDLAEASFAGAQETFLNTKGDAKLIENVKKCFSSLYTPRAIYYRKKQGFGATDALLSAIIMKMVDSEKSGVMFSKSPMGDQENITIEAVFGLGEGIVSGQINPDHYEVSRDLEIKEIKVSEKKIAIVRTSSGQDETVKLTPEKSKSQVMSQGQIIEAANYAMRLEEHYKKPQDIEFAIEANKIYIVQSRPITTLGKEVKNVGVINGKIILEGQGSSSGVGVGIVKIIKSMADLLKIKKGDVLVTEMTNPDMVVAMEKSVAIVTDEGGMTSHAAIVSREMGIPCIVATGNATSVLKDGMKITVDGTNGKVYEGAVAETHYTEIKKVVPTKYIKLKVIVDLPESSERAAQTGIDAVGLTRVEGIIAEGSKHPLQYEREGKFEDYSELLRKGLDEIAKHFNAMWIRTSDIRSDEYDHLQGAPEKEINPMLGLHGIRFSLKHPKLFEAELDAIKKVAEKYPEKKFGVMFPQVCLIEEVRGAKKLYEKYKTLNMEFGVMIETPAAVQIIEDICKEGVNFISFGTNDLTQFTLAVDRGEEDVQFLYNELNPAIYSQIRKVINMCRQYRVYTSICGQAGSKKEMAEFLFKQGINSISVNADAAYDISNLIKSLEDAKTKEIEAKRNIHPFVQPQRTPAQPRQNIVPPRIPPVQHPIKEPIKIEQQGNKLPPAPIFHKPLDFKEKKHPEIKKQVEIIKNPKYQASKYEGEDEETDKESEGLLNKENIKIAAIMEEDEPDNLGSVSGISSKAEAFESAAETEGYRTSLEASASEGQERVKGNFEKKARDIEDEIDKGKEKYTEKVKGNFEKKARDIEDEIDKGEEKYTEEDEGGGVYEKLEDHEAKDGAIHKSQFNMFDDDYKWS